jgi:hypothetical protein
MGLTEPLFEDEQLEGSRGDCEEKAPMAADNAYEWSAVAFPKPLSSERVPKVPASR